MFLDRYASFSQPWYDTPDKTVERVAYQGMGAYQRSERGFADAFGRYCPRWLAEEFTESLDSQLPLPSN